MLVYVYNKHSILITMIILRAPHHVSPGAGRAGGRPAAAWAVHRDIYDRYVYVDMLL